jgi:hypothetical protein
MTPSLPSGSGTAFRIRPANFLSTVPVIAVLAACEIPTSPPQVESRWIVPAEQTQFGVAELLPGAVSLTSDSSAFLVDFDPESFSTSLGDLCAACSLADGQTIPKPPFADAVETLVEFPSQVTSIRVLDGRVDIEVTNGLNFDPIRPSTVATGTITFLLSDDADGDVLGSVVVDGAATPFPVGSTLTRSVDLIESQVDGSISASVVFDSPLGDPVTLDTDLAVSVVASPADVRVSHVVIDVAGTTVDLEDATLDLAELDVDVADRVIYGAFLLDVVNPFGVAADFELTISGPSMIPIVKTAAIGPAPNAEVRLDFSTEEIRRVIEAPEVTLSGSAVVDPAAAPTMVDPGEELLLSASLDLTLRLGG